MRSLNRGVTAPLLLLLLQSETRGSSDCAGPQARPYYESRILEGEASTRERLRFLQRQGWSFRNLESCAAFDLCGGKGKEAAGRFRSERLQLLGGSEASASQGRSRSSSPSFCPSRSEEPHGRLWALRGGGGEAAREELSGSEGEPRDEARSGVVMARDAMGGEVDAETEDLMKELGVGEGASQPSNAKHIGGSAAQAISQI